MEQGLEQAQVAAIVLAAGGSARMGQPKQLLPISARPMVRHVTQAVLAVGLAQVVVVTGARAEAVTAVLADLPVDVELNEAWAEGMSSSIRQGLRALRPEIQAALLVLGDQPSLTPELLELLVVRYRTTGAAIVAPFYKGQRGNPVLFDRELFPELLAVQGDRGGRLLLDRHRNRVEQVDLDDPAVILDIDSPQDYEGLLGAEGR
jgi:molybdenum cofactor cytidylyltransferase